MPEAYESNLATAVSAGPGILAAASDAPGHETAPVEPAAQARAAGPKKRNVKRNGPPPTPTYRIRATVVRRNMTIGDQQLFKLLELQWPHLHHALYYICVFAPENIGGKVASAASRGMKAYVEEKLELAKQMLSSAKERAKDAGVIMGQHGNPMKAEVEVSSQIESTVLGMVQKLDDYVVVMDSLWIGGEMEDAERDAAHAEAKRTLSTMHKLAIRMRTRLVDYRKDKTASGKEQLVAGEIEQMVLSITGIDIQTKRATTPQESAEGAPLAKLPPVRRPNTGNKEIARQSGAEPAPHTPAATGTELVASSEPDATAVAAA